MPQKHTPLIDQHTDLNILLVSRDRRNGQENGHYYHLGVLFRLRYTWEFPKIRGTILGVPIIRIIVFGGLY